MARVYYVPRKKSVNDVSGSTLTSPHCNAYRARSLHAYGYRASMKNSHSIYNYLVIDAGI